MTKRGVLVPLVSVSRSYAEMRNDELLNNAFAKIDSSLLCTISSVEVKRNMPIVPKVGRNENLLA